MNSLTVVGVVTAMLALAGCATLGSQDQNQLRAQVGRQQALEGRAWDRGARPAAAVASAPAPTTHRVLTGREIQLALQRAGDYQGPVDGKLGPQTRVAIKLFQSTHQLTPDGVAGAKTMQALQTYLTPESSAPAAP